MPDQATKDRAVAVALEIAEDAGGMVDAAVRLHAVTILLTDYEQPEYADLDEVVEQVREALKADPA